MTQKMRLELLNQEEVWEEGYEILVEHLPMDTKGEKYTREDIVNILMHTATQAGTIEKNGQSPQCH